MLNLKTFSSLDQGSLKARLQAFFQRAFTTNWALTLTGLVMVVVLVGTLLGLIFDERVITAAPAWLKPAKFAISITLYSLTFVWLLGFVQGRPRLVAVAGYATAIGLMIEMLIVALQVVRGTSSHFNYTTVLDGVLFGTMGAFVAIIWAGNLLAAILLLFQKMPDPVLAWSLRLALLLTLLGAGLAVFMVVPTSAQIAQLQAGTGNGIIGAHSVGTSDGMGGLPILGWSTIGGDLRVPHFFGLHALQIMPLLGWLIARTDPNRLSTRHKLILVWTAGLGYLSFILILLVQALRGQAVTAPDNLTLIMLGSLIAIIVAVVAGVFVQANLQQHHTQKAG